jgi:hypothetical protein
MNGLIGNQMADKGPEEAPEESTEQPTGGTPKNAEGAENLMATAGSSDSQLTITPQSVLEKLTLTPKQAPQLQRIVAAGMKVMFSEKTRDIVKQELRKSDDIAMVVGQSVAGLMGILLKESNNALPLDLLIPAGLVLVAHAAEFVEKIGLPITDVDVGNATEIFVNIALHMNGISGEKMANVIDQGGAPAPGLEQPAAQPQPAGLVAGQMERPA